MSLRGETLRRADTVYLGAVLAYFASAPLGQTPRLFLACVFLVLFAVSYRSDRVRGIQLFVLMLAFPIYVQVGGRDATVVSAVAVLVAYASDFASGNLARNRRLSIPVLLLCMAFVIGTVRLATTSLAGPSIRVTVGVVTAAMLGHLVASHTRTRRDVVRLVEAVVVVLIIEAVLAIVQRVSGASLSTFTGWFASRSQTVGAFTDTAGNVRSTGTIGDYELLAEWFATGILLGLGLVSLGRGHRFLGFAGVVLCSAGITATLTRGGLYAAGLGILVFLVLAVRLGVVGLIKTMGQIGFATLLIAVLAATAGASLASQFAARAFALPSETATLEGISLLINRGLWFKLPREVFTPTLFGHGPYRPDLVLGPTFSSFHSLWITLWYQIGIFGSAIVLWLCIQLASLYISGVRSRGTDTRLYLLACSVLSGVAAIFASEFKVENIRTIMTLYFSVLITALSVAAFKILRQAHTKR